MTLKLGKLLIAIGTAAVLAQGCAGPVRKDAVPEALTTQALVPGLPDVRYRVGIDNDKIVQEGIASVRREQEYLRTAGKGTKLPPSTFLAVSGGGDDGAFGAGLLNGWTAAGNRPQFPGGNQTLIDGSEPIGVEHQLVGQDVAVALAGQVEVRVVGEVHGRGLVGGGLVVDPQGA